MTVFPRTRSVAVLACGGALLWAASAAAQYPYGDAPRPPGSVPVRPGQAPYPPPQYQPPQYQPPYQPPPQYPPPQYPQQQYPPPPGAQPYAAPARPGPIQGEELPPPGGAPASAPPVQPTALGAPGQVPPAPPPSSQGQPPPPGPNPPGRSQQQRPAAPAADVVTAPPQQRIANPTAVFNGLDKITGRLTSFESAIGETVQFGALQVTARACYSRPPTETPLTDGFVEVDEVALRGGVRRIFTGWMFAASPGLHAVEHAVYDVWLVDCKGGAGVQSAAADTPGASPASQKPPRQSGGQQRPPRQPPPR